MSRRIRHKDHPENERDNQTSKDNGDLPSRANLPEHWKTLPYFLHSQNESVRRSTWLTPLPETCSLSQHGLA